MVGTRNLESVPTQTTDENKAFVSELEREFEARLKERIAKLEEAQEEIKRVSAQIEGVAGEIAAMLDDPSIELSRVMRKRTEQAELKAYLNGLQFSIGDKAKPTTPADPQN